MPYAVSVLSADEMKAQGLPQLEAVFITVDPDRDTPEIMKNYLKGVWLPLYVAMVHFKSSTWTLLCTRG